MTGRHVITLILAILSIAATVSAGDEPARFEFSRIIMGAQARLVLYAADEPHAIKAAAAAFDRMAELDAVMSDYRQDSELMKLCEKAGQGPQPASDDLIDVLTISADIASRTGGAFDPTVGPVVQLWRQARRDAVLPPSESLARARALVNHRAVIIDHENRTIELTTPGMRLDLGGIGKGFAADEALEVLAHEGISSCLIDMSGDIRLGDPPPGADAWTITIEHDDGAREITLNLANTAIATSGDTAQHIDIDAVRYSHIVDPHTGVGLTTRAAATVIAPTGARADAFASAVCVLGPDAIALIDDVDDTTCLLTTQSESERTNLISSGFPKH